MSALILKNKISKSLDALDEQQLHSAFSIIKELINQQKLVNKSFDKDVLEQKLAKGIYELDNKKGMNFLPFLNKIQRQYSGKK